MRLNSDSLPENKVMLYVFRAVYFYPHIYRVDYDIPLFLDTQTHIFSEHFQDQYQGWFSVFSLTAFFSCLEVMERNFSQKDEFKPSAIKSAFDRAVDS
jgi:hypothetical protein